MSADRPSYRTPTAGRLSPAERGRLGGLTTARRHGREHMAAIGRRGGLATVTQHGRAHMSRIGRSGFEATCQGYWQGDRRAFADWLARMGQATQDPMPGNGYVRHPGPFPVRSALQCWSCRAWRPIGPEACPHCGAADVPF